MNAPSPEVIHPLVAPDQREHLLLGALFAVLSLPLLGEKFNWRLGVLALSCGLALSYVLTDPLARVFSLGDDFKNVLASGLGFLGYTVLGIVMAIAQIIRKDPLGTLQRFLPFWKKEG